MEQNHCLALVPLSARLNSAILKSAAQRRSGNNANIQILQTGTIHDQISLLCEMHAILCHITL